VLIPECPINRSRHARTTVKRARTLAWRALEASGNPGDGSGFIVYWPIGFAVLGWKFWQKKSGYSGDIISFGREKMGKLDELGARSDRMGYSVKAVFRFWHGLDRNRAFDEWRTTELARLEEERQKLVAAEREFAEFMEISATPGSRGVRAVHG